jgi:hypothetical protein
VFVPCPPKRHNEQDASHLFYASNFDNPWLIMWKHHINSNCRIPFKLFYQHFSKYLHEKQKEIMERVYCSTEGTLLVPFTCVTSQSVFQMCTVHLLWVTYCANCLADFREVDEQPLLLGSLYSSGGIKTINHGYDK